MDCFVELADGQQLFVNRITTGSTYPYQGVSSGGNTQQPMTCVCVCSGFEEAVKIWFKPQKGSFFIIGLGWKTEDRDISYGHTIHSDNIIGNPSSLSDERVKDNVSSLDPSNCLSFCNMLQPSLYLQTLSNEVRTGLIAQEVQAQLTAHSLPLTPVLDTKMASIDQESPAEELMSMRYERLVPMLFGAVKALTERIEQLESK